MTDDTTTLTEGTDSIITGAGVDETDLRDEQTAPLSPPAPTSTRDRVREQVRAGRDKLAGQATETARGLVSQGIERSSDALGNVSRLIGDTASGLDERLGPEYGDYARKASEAIERAATRLSQKDADELIDDARTFVQQSPGIALAGAAIAGFALVRLLKVGLEDTSTSSKQRKS